MDKHQFSTERHWQLLCVCEMVRGEVEEGRAGGKNRRIRVEGENGGYRECHESIREEKHPLAIMEKP